MEIDWFNDKAVSDFNEKQGKKFIKLHKALENARKKGDDVSIKKAMTDIYRFKVKDSEFREKAEEAGLYWI